MSGDHMSNKIIFFISIAIIALFTLNIFAKGTLPLDMGKNPIDNLNISQKIIEDVKTLDWKTIPQNTIVQDSKTNSKFETGITYNNKTNVVAILPIDEEITQTCGNDCIIEGYKWE